MFCTFLSFSSQRGQSLFSLCCKLDLDALAIVDVRSQLRSPAPLSTGDNLQVEADLSCDSQRTPATIFLTESSPLDADDDHFTLILASGYGSPLS
ncbi:hypothetical protein TIFTF001_017220 [Ficus carica]|uniref:Uncharacterized protein n=1 Tax=Ficus carica TaxID=3494 RepID=A0AA88DAI7_FICCA|nr:hypothetical protein TIFTF001_017220 [Ficus carica]